MRYVIVLLVALIIPISSQASTFHNHDVWINTKYELKVKLDFRHNRIRAKNLGTRGWSSFYKVRSGEYQNRRGDKLIIERRDIIVYSPRYTRRNVVFRPADRFTTRTRPHHNSYRSNGHNGLAGFWLVKGDNKRIEIQRSGQMLRARIEGSSRWVSYTEKDNGYYEDSRGNSYTLRANNSLVWLSDDGRQKRELYR